jgi:hypothetical protein
MKFSGHETFSCRATWLSKGWEFLEKNGEPELKGFTKPEAATYLGVGRNMVNSIRYWLHAFGIVQENNDENSDYANVQDFTSKLNEDEQPLDQFLEDPLTLWFLHYKLVKTNYATIYNFFFLHFIPRKSNDSFTEQEFIIALKSFIRTCGQTVPSSKTLENDFKVFIDMYLVKTYKANEIDDSALNILQPLELISRQRLNKEKVIFYSINRTSIEEIPIELIGYLIIKLYTNKPATSKSAELLFDEVGRPFCFSREKFFDILHRIESNYSDHFVFSQARNTGINEFQMRSNITTAEFLRIKYLK